MQLDIITLRLRSGISNQGNQANQGSDNWEKQMVLIKAQVRKPAPAKERVRFYYLAQVGRHAPAREARV